MIVFLDTGDLAMMEKYIDRVAGMTTNPSLMCKSGVTNYRQYAQTVLAVSQGKPVSFEVLADDFETMASQAREIASWGLNVFVKVPATNTHGESCANLIRVLSLEGIKLNVTAVFTFAQIETLARCMIYAPAILSIFAGRIADTGRDPVPFIMKATAVRGANTQILWASTREVLNVKQAQAAGADVITMTPDLIAKMDLFDKDLAQYSLETVKMFYNDAQGITL